MFLALELGYMVAKSVFKHDLKCCEIEPLKLSKRFMTTSSIWFIYGEYIVFKEPCSKQSFPC